MSGLDDEHDDDGPLLAARDVVPFLVGCAVFTLGLWRSSTVMTMVGIAVAAIAAIVPLRSLARRSRSSGPSHRP